MAGWEWTQQGPDKSFDLVARIGNTLYSFDIGSSQSRLSSKLDLETGIWESTNILVNIGFELGLEHRAIGIGDTVFFIHKRSGDTSTSSDISSYNTTTGNARPRIVTVPMVTEFPGITANGNDIFIVGGSYYSNGSSRGTRSVYRFNVQTDSLQYLATLPTQVAGCAVIVKDDILYCIGGAPVSDNTNALSAVQAYDIQQDSWRLFPSLGTPRAQHLVEEINDQICVIGGNGVGGRLGSVEFFDFGSDVWSYGESLPLDGYASQPAQAHLYDGIINVFTGKRLVGGPYKNYLLSYNTRFVNIDNPSPSSGFVDENSPSKFSWSLQTNPPGRAQKSAEFQWRELGGPTIHSVGVDGSETYVTVSANTFPNGAIQWRVKVVSIDDTESDWTPWYTLTTIDEPPLKPTGLYPGSGTRDGTKPIQLSWIHNSPLSTPQSAYEVEVTYDGGATWHAVGGKVTTSETLHTVPADSLGPDTTGRVGWRVRTYNSDDAASPWSDAAYFIVLFAPDAPEWRSVESGKSRPLCEWVAPGQIAYQMQITQGESVVYDTGETYGPATQHRVTEYLKNGTYIFRLRYKNQLNIWSDYADRSVSINARGRLKLSLNGEKIPNGAKLTFTVEVV